MYSWKQWPVTQQSLHGLDTSMEAQVTALQCDGGRPIGYVCNLEAPRWEVSTPWMAAGLVGWDRPVKGPSPPQAICSVSQAQSTPKPRRRVQVCAVACGPLLASVRTPLWTLLVSGPHWMPGSRLEHTHRAIRRPTCLAECHPLLQ
jgi:hypothetical protein